MGASQRNKGARGERELFEGLSAELGVMCKRNLSQTRGGGADGLDIPGWAIEVKRCEDVTITPWWAQTMEQANREKVSPILFFRPNHQVWRAVVDLSDLNGETFPVAGQHYAIISFLAACQLIRETL